jgi:hypothetical protein
MIIRGLAVALVKDYGQRYVCALEHHFDGSWSIRIGEGKQGNIRGRKPESIRIAGFLLGLVADGKVLIRGQQIRGLIEIFYSIFCSYMYPILILYLCQRPGGPIYIWGAADCIFSLFNRHTKIHYFFIYYFTAFYFSVLVLAEP